MKINPRPQTTSAIGAFLIAVAVTMTATAQQRRPEVEPAPTKTRPRERAPAAIPAPPGEPPGGPLAGGPNRGGEWFERLRRENPEEFERLQKLREENPEAFRELMRDKMRERLGGSLRSGGERFDSRSQELASSYRKAKTEEERAALRVQLEAAVLESFDARLEMQRQMVDNLEKRLAELREQVATRQANRGDICDQRVKELLEDPALRW